MKLESLNARLRAIGVPGFTKLGLSSKGEIVIDEVMPNYVAIQDLFTIVTLLVTDPRTLAKKAHLLMHDHKECCILAVLVNDEYLVTVRQHRLPWMRFLEEFARGWLTHEGPGSEPFQILERELPNLQKLGKVVQVIDRGKFALDTSWRTGKTRIVILRVQTFEPITSAEEFQTLLRQGTGKVIKPVLRHLDEVEEQFEKITNGTNEQDWLQDIHSFSAWSSLSGYLDQQETSERQEL